MSVGWFSDISKRIVSNRPNTTPLEVWLTPAPCTWDYMPTGPYRVMRGTTHNGWGIEYCGWDEGLVDETDALVVFSRAHLPRAGQWCIVADDRNQIVLGWEDQSGHLGWVGCEHMFNILAIVHNPVDAGVWSLAAKDCNARFNPLEVRP